MEMNSALNLLSSSMTTKPQRPTLSRKCFIKHADKDSAVGLQISSRMTKPVRSHMAVRRWVDALGWHLDGGTRPGSQRSA